MDDNNNLNIERALDAIALAIRNRTGITSQTNAGSAGGTIYTMNLGGVKICWGLTGNVTTTPATGTTAAVTLPTGFFTTIQSAIAGAVSVSGDARVNANFFSYNTTTGTITFWNTAGITTSVMQAHYIIIGT